MEVACWMAYNSYIDYINDINDINENTLLMELMSIINKRSTCFASMIINIHQQNNQQSFVNDKQ